VRVRVRVYIQRDRERDEKVYSWCENRSINHAYGLLLDMCHTYRVFSYYMDLRDTFRKFKSCRRIFI
jgi:hypothetical protein